jgi:pimeloyl-ACP methyl ester carboxylesterase
MERDSVSRSMRRRWIGRGLSGTGFVAAGRAWAWLCTVRGAVSALRESVDLGGGRSAAYEVVGEGEPLLYFQGGPGFSAALLRDDAELLADRFAVYLIDPPGSGGSTPPSDPALYDHLGHARFYEEVRQALGVGPATIMGISFGGIVALTYASLFPDATTRCISVASRAVGAEVEGPEAAAEMQQFLDRHSQYAWYPAARKTWDEFTERVLAAEEAGEVDAMMAEILPLYTADPDRPGVRALIERWRIDGHCDLAAIKAWESGLWQMIDIRPLLAKIERPTLVLVGALDLICGPTQGRLIAQAVPGARLVLIPDSGHFIGAEAPEQFRAEILDFCA